MCVEKKVDYFQSFIAYELKWKALSENGKWNYKKGSTSEQK